MAQRLVNALGRGLGKTVTESVKGAARKATRDVPSTQSFYKLGMGIGPFIRNTVQSYQSEPSTSGADNKKVNASLGFAKENVVTQKNIAGQLSALTSIMSDIRKISLAQLNLQRASARNVKGFGDRSGYLSQEQMLESGKPSLAGSGNGARVGGQGSGGSLLGFMANNPMLSAGLLGGLYLGFKKDIDRFLKDSGLSKLLEDLYSKVKTEVVNGVKEGISSIYNSIKEEFAAGLEKLKKDPASAITPSASITGAIAANRLINKVPIVRSIPGARLGATILGGIAGYGAGEDLEQLYRDATMEAKTPQEQARKNAAISKLTDLGIDVGAGAAGYYGIKKGYDKIFGPKVPPVTPTAPPGATMPGGSAPGGRVPLNPKTIADGSYNAWKNSQPPVTGGSNPYAAAEANKPSLLKRAMGALGEFAEKTKALMTRCVGLMEKLIEKIGIKRVVAYLAARTGLALSGAAGGPVVIITTILAAGWTLYDIVSFLMDLTKELDGKDVPGVDNPMGDQTGIPSSSQPGATPTQPPAGSLPPTGAGAGRGKQGGATAAESMAASGEFANPAPGARLTGMFGDQRTGHSHQGIDLAGKEGSPIGAAMDGTVIRADGNDANGYGQIIAIQHADGTVTKYAHLSKMFVQKGTIVKKGQTIGEMGSTGKSSGPHLHFEVVPKGGSAIDPLQKLPGLKGQQSSQNSSSSNMSSDQVTAPGAAPNASSSSSLNSAFATAFGFDPSKMGLDLEKAFTGQDLENLKKLQKEINMSPTVAQAPASNPSNPNPAPAQQKTVHNTQSKEKDFLHYYYNPMQPQYT